MGKTVDYKKWKRGIFLLSLVFHVFWLLLLTKKKKKMITIEGTMDNGELDDIIRRLLDGKGGRQVQLSEAEVKMLCVHARPIFDSEPNLLRIQAPIKICGMNF